MVQKVIMKTFGRGLYNNSESIDIVKCQEISVGQPTLTI